MTEKKLRGFAAMSKERQLELARAGGSSVPPEKRSFSQDRALASRAGAKGGRNPMTPRAFTKNSELAKRAGKLGVLARIAGKQNKEVG